VFSVSRNYVCVYYLGALLVSEGCNGTSLGAFAVGGVGGRSRLEARCST
jgi:hypothetical protein